MTREEFSSLPVGVALGILYDINAPALVRVLPPETARPPKYDQKIRRKGGYQWASETDTEGIKFWLGRAAAGAEDPKYGDKNVKQAKALKYWLVWREQNPNAVWSGERNKQYVTAAAPLERPMIHEWEPQTTSGDIFSQPDKPATEPATDPDDFDRAL